MANNNYEFNDFVQNYPILFLNSDIPELWQPVLASVLNNKIESLENIVSHLREETVEWVPSSEEIWTFTKFCCPCCVKVIIVGQDPPCDASGLAFSSRETIYDSTVNILDEVKRDIGAENLRPFPREYGNLEYWARQGVLLLNSALTKSIGGDSHLSIGWQDITGELIKQLQNSNEKIVFMFWGWYARTLDINVGKIVVNDLCNILKAGHPSSRNDKNDFLGCRHFSQANKWLKQHNIDEIDWCPVPKLCAHLGDFGE
ncbi:unnamed protein product [Diabrotica balteata]|uniref:Uracil-DNA glycosylase-like domain-containing protein n=1 Tax=Diabrotica balteata TaxID=107213 RepID=A0A9N9SWC2_DIABA|nr:unnamed protein product [Diabrotica balteata]